MIALYKVFINAEYNNLTKHNCNERDHLLKSIGMLNDRLNKAHRKVFEEKLDPLDFKLMKGDCENEIGELERKLVSLQSDNPKSIEGFFGDRIKQFVANTKPLEGGLSRGATTRIGSIFSENLIYDGEGNRTARINEAVRLIYYLMESGLHKTKNGTSDGFINLYRFADRTVRNQPYTTLDSFNETLYYKWFGNIL